MKQITDCILQAFLVMIQIVKIHGDRCKELTDIVTISLKKKKGRVSHKYKPEIRNTKNENNINSKWFL